MKPKMNRYVVPVALAISALSRFGQSSPHELLPGGARKYLQDAKNADEAQQFIDQSLGSSTRNLVMAQLLGGHINTRVRALQKSLQGRLNNQQLSSADAPKAPRVPWESALLLGIPEKAA